MNPKKQARLQKRLDRMETAYSKGQKHFVRRIALQIGLPIGLPQPIILIWPKGSHPFEFPRDIYLFLVILLIELPVFYFVGWLMGHFSWGTLEMNIEEAKKELEQVKSAEAN